MVALPQTNTPAQRCPFQPACPFTLPQVYTITCPGSIICQHCSRPAIVGIIGEVWPPDQHFATMKMCLSSKVRSVVEVKPAPDH